MPYTATLIRNEDEYRERLDRSEDGWAGQRVYRVLGDSIESAHTATGLPRIGDSWSAAYPQVRVVGISPEYVGGRDDIGNGTQGLMRVTVTYRTPRASRWTTGPRGPGDLWSEMYLRETSQRINFGYNPNTTNTDPPSGDPPLFNGDGAQIKVGEIEVRVFRFYAAGSAIDIPRYLSLSRPAKLNLGSVTLPPIKRVGTTFNLAQGQALYRGFEIDYAANGDEDLIGVVHTIDIAEDFDVIWEVVDERGRPRNASARARLYEFASFAGLW